MTDPIARPLKRLPKQTLHRTWTPKLGRTIMLTSARQLHLRTMLEANPGVTRYCERPTRPDLAGIADHTSGLETAALAAGYASWHELQQANQRHNAEAHPPDAQPESVPPPAPATGLIVDPVLPDSFDNTPNQRRSRKELDQWWDRPFALSNEDGSFDVRCLDGGAWNRATYYGTAVSLEEAATLARDKLARWQRMRAEPVVMIDGPAAFRVAIMPQRPGEKPTVLRTCASGEEASQYLAAYKGSA